MVGMGTPFHHYYQVNTGIGGRETYEEIPACLGVSLAKVLIFSLTTEIPRSSDALSSNTLALNKSGLYC